MTFTLDLWHLGDRQRRDFIAIRWGEENRVQSSMGGPKPRSSILKGQGWSQDLLIRYTLHWPTSVWSGLREQFEKTDTEGPTVFSLAVGISNSQFTRNVWQMTPKCPSHLRCVPSLRKALPQLWQRCVCVPSFMYKTCYPTTENSLLHSTLLSSMAKQIALLIYLFLSSCWSRNKRMVLLPVISLHPGIALLFRSAPPHSCPGQSCWFTSNNWATHPSEELRSREKQVSRLSCSLWWNTAYKVTNFRVTGNWEMFPALGTVIFWNRDSRSILEIKRHETAGPARCNRQAMATGLLFISHCSTDCSTRVWAGRHLPSVPWICVEHSRRSRVLCWASGIC